MIGGDYKDDVETFNPLKSSGSGALSRFFRMNPMTHRAPEDTTLRAIWEASDEVELSLMYAADGAETAIADDKMGGFDSGLFGGTMGAYQVDIALKVLPTFDSCPQFQSAMCLVQSLRGLGLPSWATDSLIQSSS